MNIKLYHLPNSRSQRIIWLFEELQCNYTVIKSKDVPLHLKGIKFPTVEIEHDGSNLVLSETSAIIEFLCIHFQKFIPDMGNIKDTASFFFWKNYTDGSFMPDLALKQVFNHIVIQTPFPVRFISQAIRYGFNKGYLENSLKSHLDKIEKHLFLKDWMADEFSILDLLLWFPLVACFISASKADYPKITQYLERIHNRHAFKMALLAGNWSDEEFQRYWK